MENHEKSKDQLIKELAVRTRIITKMLETFDLDSRLEIILDELTAFFDIDIAGIYLVDNESVTLRSHRGLPSRLRYNMISFSLSELPGWIRPISILHVKPDGKTLIPDFALSEGIQAMMIIPLFIPEAGKSPDKKWIGSIFVASRRHDAFTGTDASFLHTIARPLAFAIENVRLFESVQCHSLELEKSVVELKKISGKLEESIDSLIKIHKIARMGRWDWDIVENRMSLSEENYNIFGIDVREFGGTYEAALNLVHPEDLEFVKKSVDKALHEGGPFDVQHRIVLNDGSLRHLHQRAIICFDDAGRPVRMIGTAQDITEIKRMEQLANHQGKMASLGHVSMGIAHEIRNPLSGINIILDALKENMMSFDNFENAVEMINEAKAASGKIEGVIKRAMDFARPGPVRLKQTDVNKFIEEAIRLSAHDLEKSQTKLITDLEKNLPPVYVDGRLIEQVVLNMITNAIDAMEELEENKILSIASLSREDFIFIKIGDSGHGIGHDEREKIFQPFYTGKKRGSGIGLSICSRIIFDHNGEIQVSDSPLGGAEFVIKIPI